MKVAIVGYGDVEGHAALEYWKDQGAQVTVCDMDEKKHIPAGVHKQLGKDYLQGLDDFDVILRSPGLHPKIILAANPYVAGKITTTINEFLRVCPTKNIIGVTGTKGKGTTSALIASMLEAAGKKVFMGGNFGLSPFTFLDKVTPDSWVVLELSSFMLYDVQRSPHIGVCLMVQPEHLDWHGSDTDYIRSKSNMFAHQGQKDIAIYYAGNIVSHRIASTSPGDKIAYFDEPGAYIYDGTVMIDQTVLCKTSELKLLGEHNWQNVCAAVTATWQAVQAPGAIREALLTFTGLPHRLELVRELDGIRFYNDSFASDPYATEAAIQAVPGHKVMIVGGYERGLPLEGFAEFAADNKRSLRGMLLVGQSAGRIAEALQHAGYKNFQLTTTQTMPGIVSEAYAMAKHGDAVVLSPGFASFDMFKNFEVRGRAFKEAVHSL